MSVYGMTSEGTRSHRPPASPRPCKVCGKPLPPTASSGRRYCDGCKSAGTAVTRALAAASHVERHLVELVRFRPSEGRPYVLCTCEARLELPEDVKPGDGPRALAALHGAHRRENGFGSVPISDILGSRRKLPARFTPDPEQLAALERFRVGTDPTDDRFTDKT